MGKILFQSCLLHESHLFLCKKIVFNYVSFLGDKVFGRINKILRKDQDRIRFYMIFYKIVALTYC